jgi:hypothetical protein
MDLIKKVQKARYEPYGSLGAHNNTNENVGLLGKQV